MNIYAYMKIYTDIYVTIITKKAINLRVLEHGRGWTEERWGGRDGCHYILIKNIKNKQAKMLLNI